MFELDRRLVNDTIHLGDFELCRVLLMNDSQYPWIILVPTVDGITEIHQLSAKQRMVLSKESNQVAELLAEEFDPDKMNIAALGNVVSQLHIHHIVRYQNDIAWPAPVWGVAKAKPYSKRELEDVLPKLKLLVESLKH